MLTRYLFSQVALKFLIGCLYINFTLLWEPLLDLIQSHATKLGRDEFWEIWGRHLKSAAEASGEFLTNYSGIICLWIHKCS